VTNGLRKKQRGIKDRQRITQAHAQTHAGDNCKQVSKQVKCRLTWTGLVVNISQTIIVSPIISLTSS